MYDILTKDEVKLIVKRLKTRRSKTNAALNLAIFRLSCCSGLRRCEISGLIMADFLDNPVRPKMRIRKEATKGERGKRRGRLVPLYWDSASLDDLRSWYKIRLAMGAKPDDPFVCCLKGKYIGRRLTPAKISSRWRHVVSILGAERARLVPCHSGRRTYLSHVLSSGRSLVEARDAAGHRDIKTTSRYLYAIETDAPDLFG